MPGRSGGNGETPQAAALQVGSAWGPALRGALLFAGIGVLWIVFSDRLLLAMAPSPEAFARLQTWKGSLFVLATSVLLYGILQVQLARRSRQALRLVDAAQRLRIQIENSPLALIELDAAMRLTRWSPRAEELFGWEEAEVLGRTLDEVGLVHPEDRDGVNAALSRHLEGSDVGSIHTNRNLRKDGEVVHCEWYNSWIRDPDGSVVALVSLAHDVSWQREAVAEVRRMNRELEARVHRRTEELAQANADLKAFTYSVSHDLRAPVRAVLGFGDILRRRYGPDLPEEASRYLEHILEAGIGMDRLIDRLVEFGRMEADPMELAPVDPGALARRVVHRFETPLSECGGTVHIEDGPPSVQADPHLLERVMQNLVENAIRYRSGSRPLRITLSATSAPAPGGTATGRVRLRLEDTGTGIPEAHRDRVFRLFERMARADAPLEDAGSGSPEAAGSGLGLSIVRRAMERMHGRAWVEDRADGEPGAALVLELPEATP